ncbi:hypothetical protein PMAYCL1PPCAC_01045, partial [Pristionchus mayeri]
GDNNYESLGNFDAGGAPPPPPPPGGGGADKMYEGLGGPGPDAVPPPPPPPPPPPKMTQSEKRAAQPIRDDDGVDLDSEKRKPTKRGKKGKKKVEEDGESAMGAPEEGTTKGSKAKSEGNSSK